MFVRVHVCMFVYMRVYESVC